MVWHEIALSHQSTASYLGQSNNEREFKVAETENRVSEYLMKKIAVC